MTAANAAIGAAPLSRSLALGAIPTALFLIVATRGLFDPAVGYPDADRLAMDGVFIYDFLRSGLGAPPMEFAERYFAQYPALSIGYKPPFFPFVAALFHLVFGVEWWVGRLAVICFGALGAFAWHRLAARLVSPEAACLSTSLLVTTPFFAQWNWYTMTETPTAALILLSGLLFQRFLDSARSAWLFGAAAAVACAAWTKQPAAYAAGWLFLYGLWAWGPKRLLLRKDVWAAAALFALALIPLVVLTLHFGKLNVQQSVGGELKLPTMRFPDLFFVYPRYLFEAHLPPAVAALSVVGIVAAIWRRDGRLVCAGLLIATTYATFTALNHKIPRYAIYWIPAFCLFAAMPFEYLRERARGWRLAALGVGATVVVASNLAAALSLPQRRFQGIEAAAQAAVAQARSPIILVDAYYNGFFTYFVRANDPDRRFWVMRGDKLFSSSAINPGTWQQVHAHSRDDLRRILDEYGVDVVVVETRELTGVPIHQEFRDWLRTPDFELLREIRTDGNGPEYRDDQSLAVYRYRNRKPPTASHLELRLPVVGKTLKVPLEGFPGAAN